MNTAKESTIYDIAHALSLSPSTISRALNNHESIPKATRSRILKKASELDYRGNVFASNLKRYHTTNTVGLIVPQLNTPFMADVLSGIEMVANESGYNLMVRQSTEHKKATHNAKALYKNRIDGLLISTDDIHNDNSWFKELSEQTLPVVMLGESLVQPPLFESITVNNFDAAYEVIEHLSRQGCKRVAYVAPHLKAGAYANQLRGYRQAVQDKRLSCAENLVLINKKYEHSAIEACDALLKLKTRPDAILFASDLIAAASINHFISAGIRIPSDMCIASMGNDSLCTFTEPNLTSVNFPAMELGRLAVSTLIGMIESNKDTTSIPVTLPHELIIRASSNRVR